MNAPTSAQFIADIERYGAATRRRFSYGKRDLRLLFLTRSLALMAISKLTYRSLFGSSLDEDFFDVLQALRRNELVEDCDGEIRLTERGMFNADAIAGTFAFRRASKLIGQNVVTEDDAVHHHMG